MSSAPERHKPQKKWGQNFLRNPGAVRRIVDAVSAAPGQRIVEIGPGEGVVTRELVKLPNEVTLIEIDPSLAARLEQEFSGRVELILGDATRVPFPSEPFVAVGNLPYNVATPIIRRIVRDHNFQRAIFMVQKEVADRLTARAGDDAYGFLTLAVALHATTRTLMTLEPGSFFPPPKVRSAVVVFDRHAAEIKSEAGLLERLMSASFRMRRKKLINNLSATIPKPHARGAIEGAALSLDVRAEELTLDDFDRLAVAIGPVALARFAAPPEELP